MINRNVPTPEEDAPGYDQWLTPGNFRHSGSPLQIWSGEIGHQIYSAERRLNRRSAERRLNRRLVDDLDYTVGIADDDIMNSGNIINPILHGRVNQGNIRTDTRRVGVRVKRE